MHKPAGAAGLRPKMTERFGQADKFETTRNLAPFSPRLVREKAVQLVLSAEKLEVLQTALKLAGRRA